MPCTAALTYLLRDEFTPLVVIPHPRLHLHAHEGRVKENDGLDNLGISDSFHNSLLEYFFRGTFHSLSSFHLLFVLPNEEK